MAAPKLHKGPKGGVFYMKKGRKVYVKKAGAAKRPKGYKTPKSKAKSSARKSASYRPVQGPHHRPAGFMTAGRGPVERPKGYKTAGKTAAERAEIIRALF